MTEESDEIIDLLRQMNDRLERVDQKLDEFDTRLKDVEGREYNDEQYLISKALEIDAPSDSGVLLCLDFGTARSKAFATDGADDILLDIAVGQRAGGDSVHSVFSCVYISDDGYLYFGDVAAEKSQGPISRGSRKRIDSFKSMITNAAPGTDLRGILLDEHTNPTAASLTEGDVLTLYLAYLTDLAQTELVEKHGQSKYALRRFTTPVFTERHLNWASETLRKHYAEAVLVADYFHDSWQDGLDADEAYKVVRAASRNSERVAYLLADPIVEPVSAFASRFRNYEPKYDRRELITIADIGAGTTDFASFAFVETIGRGIKMFRIPGSVRVVRKAGNEVDRLLYEYILDAYQRRRPGLDDDTFARIKAELALQQRARKEELFVNGRCRPVLSDDTPVEVELSDFLQSEAVREFESNLAEEFVESLKQMSRSWLTEFAQGRVVVVKTGGGSRLPMAERFGNERVTLPERVVDVLAVKLVPPWVEEDYAELLHSFPQLAVAIGGASRDIPELADEEYTSFKGLAESGTWRLPVAYKGS